MKPNSIAMKSIRFNFNHPVKGHASLVPLSSRDMQCRRVPVTSTDDNLLEVPVTGCSEGRWRLILDWEYNGQNFLHQEEFDISESGV